MKTKFLFSLIMTIIILLSNVYINKSNANEKPIKEIFPLWLFQDSNDNSHLTDSNVKQNQVYQKSEDNKVKLNQNKYDGFLKTNFSLPDSDITNVKEVIGYTCIAIYDACTAYCLNEENTPSDNCDNVCYENCLIDCKSAEDVCLAPYGLVPAGIVSKLVEFNPILLSGGGISIGGSNTIKIGDLYLPTGEVDPFEAVSPTITNISLSAKGINSVFLSSSPISLGTASYNSMDGYYELTIAADALSALSGDVQIEIDANVADASVPVIPGICNTPGHYQIGIIAQLHD